MSSAATIIDPPKRIVSAPKVETAFGCPRNFLGNRFVYTVISPRAKSLSIGVNMNPDRHCNFDCAYCEVDRNLPKVESRLETEVMASELARTLELVRSGKIRECAFFNSVPAELLKLRHVTLSGDGEPTLCPNFTEAIQAVTHVRARHPVGFFKIVLISNATGFDLPEVEQGMRYLIQQDEVWAKLEAGTQQYMDRVNRGSVSLENVLSNILRVARERPVIIQSLFPSIDGAEPCGEEVKEYALRLLELKNAGAKIPLVQIYSATRPTPHSECGHLPLRTLSGIAQTVRQVAGLKVEIY